MESQMLRLIAIVGTNAPRSYNRKLLQYMKQRYEREGEVSMEIREISAIPLFSEDLLDNVPVPVQELNTAISNADGVIFATPEYDHSITAALKSVIEWLSSLPEMALSEKPVMIVGASLGNLGSVRAQDHLRQILNSPGTNAFVMPGLEFLLGRAPSAFDENGDLVGTSTVDFLDQCFRNYRRWTAAHCGPRSWHGKHKDFDFNDEEDSMHTAKS